MPTVAWSSVKLPLVEKMKRRFDQTWDLMLMAITLSALATPAIPVAVLVSSSKAAPSGEPSAKATKGLAINWLH